MNPKIYSCLIGYAFGCFLTAELIAHIYAGKGARELGDTGNPGMANIMASLGFVPGILTLLGDLGKCILAALLCRFLFPDAGWIVTLYAGAGCTLGHDFPFWRGFRGGKGVATSSLVIVLYSPLWGLAANILGMLVVFATKYLSIGGIVIPAAFGVMMLLAADTEAAAIAAVLTILSVYCHASSLLGIRSGKTISVEINPDPTPVEQIEW